jgi:hypothetical protein
MTHTCRSCNRTFTSELKYELHQDTCSDGTLVCSQCGEKFSERRATRDGWHYRCPNEECEAKGLGDDLRSVGDFTVAPTQ